MGTRSDRGDVQSDGRDLVPRIQVLICGLDVERGRWLPEAAEGKGKGLDNKFRHASAITVAKRIPSVLRYFVTGWGRVQIGSGTPRVTTLGGRGARRKQFVNGSKNGEVQGEVARSTPVPQCWGTKEDACSEI